MTWLGRALRGLLGRDRRRCGRGAVPRRLYLGVGVNRYLGSPANALRGCVNDAEDVGEALAARGFAAHHRPLLDGAATRRRTLQALGDLCARLRAGDVAVVWWSSHGTLTDDPREPDGQVEALCPTDALVDWPRNLVTARDVAAVLRTVADGAVVLVGADACHSGVRPADVDLLASRGMDGPAFAWRKARALTPPSWVGPSTRRTVRSIAAVAGETETTWTRTVLLSGCRSDQTSADAFIDDRARGAMTWAFLRALDERRGGGLAEVHARMVALLSGAPYEQEPQLQGSAVNLELRL